MSELNQTVQINFLLKQLNQSREEQQKLQKRIDELEAMLPQVP